MKKSIRQLVSQFLIVSTAVVVSSAAMADTRTYQKIGNTVFSSDGTSYNRIGNTVHGSNGSTYTRIGNTVFARD